MIKGRSIAVLCCVAGTTAGFLLGRWRSAPHLEASSTNEAENIALSVAAEMSVTKTWVKLLERGDTNRATAAMMDKLVIDDMILSGLLDEYPHGTNVMLISNVLLRTRQFLDVRLPGDQKRFVELRWGSRPFGDSNSVSKGSFVP